MAVQDTIDRVNRMMGRRVMPDYVEDLHQRTKGGRSLIGRLETAAIARDFLLAGNATITLRSTKTMTRFTYKVKKPSDWDRNRPIWFLSLLSGPDNEDDYSYIGILTLGQDALYRIKQTAKSKVGPNAPSLIALAWSLDHILNRDAIPPDLEVWHEGRCGRCGRKLTVPASIERGIGPDCAEMM